MVDAFAPKCNAQFPRYWTQAQDAFSKDWGRDHLWVNASFSGMQDVVLKAIMDQAQGINDCPCVEATCLVLGVRRDSPGSVGLAG